MRSMLETLKVFRGLRHRCEFVATIAGVEFYNDSKGTNIGATLAAITGLERRPAKLIVILGGEGKGQNFSDLTPALKESLCRLVLIGRDASIIANAVGDASPYEFASSMQDAVKKSFEQASQGDAVLLSPACASFDMFKNYEDRGDKFCAAVEELCH
jgi:UDP-N-acetylmuramoylalanine--D-glutamate ligase